MRSIVQGMLVAVAVGDKGYVDGSVLPDGAEESLRFYAKVDSESQELVTELLSMDRGQAICVDGFLRLEPARGNFPAQMKMRIRGLLPPTFLSDALERAADGIAA